MTDSGDLSNHPSASASAGPGHAAANLPEAGRPPRSSGFFFASLVVIVLLVGGLLCAMGAVVQRAFWFDDLILLDGGWRVLQGQTPHVDFHTTLGPVTFMIIAGGMKLVGPCVSAIAWANGILLVIVSFWAWGLSRARMSPVLSFLSALGAGLVGGGTACYAWGYLHIPYTGYAALYNRYGEAFTVLVLIEALWPLRPPTGRWQPLAGGLSSGVALVLLLFTKLNFFGAAALGIGVGALLLQYGRARWVGLALGMAIAGGLMLAYLRFDVLAIVNDMLMSIHARLERTYSEWPRIFHALTFTVTQIYLVLALWWIAPPPAGANRRGLSPKVQQGLLVAYIVAAQLAFHWSNGQMFSSTLFAWAALLILHGRSAQVAGEATAAGREVGPGTVAPATWRAVRLIAAVPIGLVILSNLASIALAAGHRLTVIPRVKPEQKFASTSMADLVLFNGAEVAGVNDGFDLLRRHTGPQERVLVLYYVNPFSFGLLRPSPTGDSVWWDENGSYSPSHHPDPAKVFAKADAVMVPTKELPGSGSGLLLKIYGEELSRRFMRAAASEHWVLYRRTQSATNAPVVPTIPARARPAGD